MSAITGLARAIIGLRQTEARQTRQIADLITAVKALQDALIAVNGKTKRVTETTALAVGNNDVTITWPTPWPDTFYGVYIELISGPTPLGTMHPTLKVGSKTETGCVVTVNATQIVASVGVDVLGVRTDLA